MKTAIFTFLACLLLTLARAIPVKHSNADDNLPLIQNTDKRSHSDDICTYCLDAFDENDLPSIALKCTHHFHKECISAWVKKNQASRHCPVCRRNLDAEELLTVGDFEAEIEQLRREFSEIEKRFKLNAGVAFESLDPEMILYLLDFVGGQEETRQDIMSEIILTQNPELIENGEVDAAEIQSESGPIIEEIIEQDQSAALSDQLPSQNSQNAQARQSLNVQAHNEDISSDRDPLLDQRSSANDDFNLKTCIKCIFGCCFSNDTE